ncbi:MAG TPA: type VI secretion system baseplate subunit TssG [Verrucomicrobiales bacterium]|jgi:type VI secretion system protein ImpH|nr:type VI secretion system baseplate subunit TssG [Verrucomicrobiales bacterium]
MADSTRKDSGTIIDDLLSHPWDYDFFGALRCVESSRPDLPRIGKSRALRQDPIRFGQYLSLGFATSGMEKPHLTKQEGHKLMVRFTGLTGPNGPLPLRYTDFIRNRLRGMQDPDLRGPREEAALSTGGGSGRDSTLAEFIDIFHHRIISLFYRAWAVSHKTVDLDRPEDRTFAEWIASTFGCGLPEMEGLDAVPAIHRLPFAGHLSCQTRHAAGLRGLLSDYFETQVEVENFAGQWIDIPEEQRCRMGESRETGLLGKSCVVGSKLWDRQMKCAVRIGPMTFAQYELFLPRGTGHSRLHAWMAFYTRSELYWEAAIVLRKEDVPKTKLGSAGRLGYTTWLTSVPPAKDADQFRVRGGGLSEADNT